MMFAPTKKKKPGPTQAVMPDAGRSVLIGVLAASDARFSPAIFNTVDRGIILEQQRLFRTAGVPWSSARITASAATGIGRSGARRVLAEMGVADLVEVRNPSGHRTLTARLKPKGEAMARAICGVPTMEAALPLLDMLYALRDDARGFEFCRDSWTRETVLANVENYDGTPATSRKIVNVREDMLPVLVAGWAISNADVHGHVSFAITPEGEEVARGRLKVKPALGPSPATFDEAAQEKYCELRDTEEALLANTERVTTREIGVLPLPVCPSLRGQNAANQSP